MNGDIIRGVQCRAARAMLGWSRKKLSNKSTMAENTLRDFEKQNRDTHINNILAIRKTLEQAGIVFINSSEGIGVRFRSVVRGD